jgi:hypothetical protein
MTTEHTLQNAAGYFWTIRDAATPTEALAMLHKKQGHDVGYDADTDQVIFENDEQRNELGDVGDWHIFETPTDA